MDSSARHLRLLTEAIAAVNSTLDLDEVFDLIAHKVAEALETDACFVYLYDEGSGELVLRASFGTRVDEMTAVPKMRPGEGITGTAAAERAPVMIAREAHLDPRFKSFPNLREEHYQSILAVPILAKERLEGALNVRTEEPREFTSAEIDLLMAIAGQVAQAIENAKLYEHALRGVVAQEIHHRVKNNLQTVASLLRLQARAHEVDPRKALSDSANRILAIAAVHEVLTERRDEDVDLGELVERLRAMLVQGLGAGKNVRSRVESVSLPGVRASALALVFSELFQNALEHGGNEVDVELARGNGRVLLTVADNGVWTDTFEEGTGLSIVRALVHDELKGTLSLASDRGLRAVVSFPAE